MNKKVWAFGYVSDLFVKTWIFGAELHLVYRWDQQTDKTPGSLLVSVTLQEPRTLGFVFCNFA